MPNITILRGDQYTLREDLSSAAITPGHLLKFDTNGQLVVHATANGKADRMFAIEAANIGYDTTKAYVSGDRVQYADCAPGVIVWAHLASGQSVSRGDQLSSAAAGALQAYGGSADPVASADENANNTNGPGTLRFRARVM
jgi:hypothetical protein